MALSQSARGTILFEEDSPHALNNTLEILYCPEEFLSYSACGSEAETDALLDKYQLYGVRKIVARSIEANNHRLFIEAVVSRQSSLIREHQTLIASHIQDKYRLEKDIGGLKAQNEKLQWTLISQPGMRVCFKDKPPIGTRVASRYGDTGKRSVNGMKVEVLKGAKGRISDIHYTLIHASVTVQWNNGIISDNVYEGKLVYA